ncbi:hypothetical protein GCM10023094_52230 [Rhodococcus olei]|uniref:Uncharacterized protein n=1 Tax=Rhodococcus olei TaxID=2161675 RepID=A0ABP8PMR8_9NOCA
MSPESESEPQPAANRDTEARAAMVNVKRFMTGICIRPAHLHRHRCRTAVAIGAREENRGRCSFVGAAPRRGRPDIRLDESLGGIMLGLAIGLGGAALGVGLSVGLGALGLGLGLLLSDVRSKRHIRPLRP